MENEKSFILEDFSSICRVCLLKYNEDALIFLNELYLVDGDIRLLDFLSKYTEIEENESYPQRICNDCIIKAEAAYCFFLKCREATLVLNQFINLSQNINEKCSYSEDTKEEHDQGCEVIKVINDAGDQENIEIKIILEKNDTKENNSEWGDGNQKFFLHHISSLDTEDNVIIDKCEFCNMEFTQEGMEEHRLKFGHYDESESIRCPFCDTKTQDIPSLNQHLRKFHSNHRESKKYICEICSKVFKWSKNYEQHLQLHNLTSEEKVICPQCGILLNSQSALQIHRGKHHASSLNMIWTCKYCTVVYKKISELKKHLREIHGEKDFHCIICGEDCKDKRTLYYHEQIHLNDYGIDCTYCNKKLLTEEKLMLHQRIHKYVKKKHVCNFCNKGFKQMDKLEAHERIHTGEKPFKCNFCEKAFNHQNNLRHHIRIHTGDTPYKCLFCSKEFSNSHSLRKHMKSHG